MLCYYICILFNLHLYYFDMSKNLEKNNIILLVEIYDRAFDKRAWHGPNLKGALKSIKPDELLWRPQKGRHNIWEIALHCAYWKYVVYRKLTGAKKGSFPRKPSDWPTCPVVLDTKNWTEDFNLLLDWHSQLRQAILDFPENKLYKTPAESKVTYIENIYGASSHDLYHAGQIQLIKRMFRKKD